MTFVCLWFSGGGASSAQDCGDSHNRMFVLPWIPIGLAATALAGWIFHVETLKRLFLPGVPMNSATAVALLLLGGGALIGRKSHPLTMALAVAALAGGGAVGLLKLLDLLAGTHLGIDSWLFADQLATQMNAPSQMASNTAICLIICAAAIGLARVGGERQAGAAQILAVMASTPPFLALLGALYGVSTFYAQSPFTGMALVTAASILPLAGHVQLTTRHSALMAPIFDDGPGGRTARLLIPVGVLAPIAIGWLEGAGGRTHLYPEQKGDALAAVADVIVFTGLVWWNARALRGADQSRRLAEERLAHAATHDFLTGLANREQFGRQLDARLAAFQRRPMERFGVVYLDLDGFKQVNDRLGHEAGDELLRQVAGILKGCLRAEDLVGRLGGDEFTILLDRIAGPDDFDEVAARILAGVPRAVGPSDQRIPMGVSLGFVCARLRHEVADDLLKEADEALFAAKKAGKGQAWMFDDTIRRIAGPEAHGGGMAGPAGGAGPGSVLMRTG